MRGKRCWKLDGGRICYRRGLDASRTLELVGSWAQWLFGSEAHVLLFRHHPRQPISHGAPAKKQHRVRDLSFTRYLRTVSLPVKGEYSGATDKSKVDRAFHLITMVKLAELLLFINLAFIQHQNIVGFQLHTRISFFLEQPRLYSRAFMRICERW